MSPWTVSLIGFVPGRNLVISIRPASRAVEASKRSVDVVTILQDLVIVGGSLCRIQLAQLEDDEGVQPTHKEVLHTNIAVEIRVLEDLGFEYASAKLIMPDIFLSRVIFFVITVAHGQVHLEAGILEDVVGCF